MKFTTPAISMTAWLAGSSLARISSTGGDTAGTTTFSNSLIPFVSTDSSSATFGTDMPVATDVTKSSDWQYWSHHGEPDSRPAMESTKMSDERTFHTVHVGMEQQLLFNPPQIQANKGDVIEFIFHETNHSVTESTLSNPCIKSLGGFDSGFRYDSSVPGFSQTVAFNVGDDTPRWFFCAQTIPQNHCEAGMVFGLNPGSLMNMFLDNAQIARSINATMGTTTSPPTSSLPITAISPLMSFPVVPTSIDFTNATTTTLIQDTQAVSVAATSVNAVTLSVSNTTATAATSLMSSLTVIPTNTNSTNATTTSIEDAQAIPFQTTPVGIVITPAMTAQPTSETPSLSQGQPEATSASPTSDSPLNSLLSSLLPSSLLPAILHLPNQTTNSTTQMSNTVVVANWIPSTIPNITSIIANTTAFDQVSSALASVLTVRETTPALQVVKTFTGTGTSLERITFDWMIGMSLVLHSIVHLLLA